MLADLGPDRDLIDETFHAFGWRELESVAYRSSVNPALVFERQVHAAMVLASVRDSLGQAGLAEGQIFLRVLSWLTWC